MNNLIIVAGLLALMAMAYQLGMVKSTRQSVRSKSGQALARAHSRPHHHGALVAFWTVVPAALILIVGSWLSPWVIQQLVLTMLPEHVQDLGRFELSVVLRRIGSIANGFGVTDTLADWEVAAAQFHRSAHQFSRTLLIALACLSAAGGLIVSYRRVNPLLRARNTLERLVQAALFTCSALAILTTLGIVLSMIGETLHFFTYISPADFFLGTTWNPRFASVGEGGDGEFGLLPLLSGTLLVAAVALSIAIPLGLLSAIYLAEYASVRFRNLAKPVIEVLAGIPTIVYGFFALVTVGPFLAALGALLGLEIRATSALTAGVVMGIMIIPFISSLSDDILIQVPQALRDGSLGIGATKSETIRKVVLPAALPGIAGAVLLAASRAIGETMIVVLAAGNAPTLTANPFQAVSTITVTIVNQLTGDNDFSSPQSLVAFALGLTLFVLTLGLNVIALIIVRKFREQYE